MKTYAQKTISILLSLILISINSQAAITGTPTTNDSGDSITCTERSSTDFMPVGDTRGNSVLTKREVIRDCNLHKTIQGECIRWEEDNTTTYLSPSDYNTYDSKNYSDSLGSLYAALGSYDQFEHLWSGWKGYCEIGTKSDFSWAEDPMFWGSLAVSTVMAGSAKGKFLDGTALGSGVQAAQETAGQAMGGLADSAMNGMVTDNVDNIAFDAAANVVSDVDIGWEAAFDAAYDSAVSTFYQNLGSCIINSGFNIAFSLYEFSQDTDSGLTCDPVDEVCSEDAMESEQSDIQTMDEDDFNTLVESFENQEPPEDIYDYIEIVNEENGIIAYRMKKLSQMDGVAQMDSSQLNELQDEIKEKALELSLAMNALALGSCLYGTGDAGVSEVGGTESDRADLRTGLSAGIGFAAQFMGPYGPIISATLKVLMYVATSYQSIDTCFDEDDAKEAGSRQEQTQKSLKFNLCHHVSTKCAEYSMLAGSFLQNDCVLDGYYYCCYDQIMTKILVEQLKAELGRDWAHCSGISIRDLNYVSFRQCRPSEMNDGTHFDGAHQVCYDAGCYDPTQSFQYYYKCVDMTEFLEYLKATTDTDISMEDFEEFWNDITEQNPDGGATY